MLSFLQAATQIIQRTETHSDMPIRNTTLLQTWGHHASRKGWLYIPLLFVIFLVSLGPWWSIYLINFDEGLNLMKAVLVADGFKLYADIWSDQPPVFTYILAVKELLLPRDVGEARCITLIFSCILLGSFFRIVHKHEGTAAAWFGTILLAGGSIYEVLSVSVMIGLPALALALLAMERATNQHGWIGIVFSGFIFALALQTKLFVLPFLSFFMLLLLQDTPHAPKRRRDRIMNCCIWASAAALTFLLISTALRQPLLEQLISPHLDVSLKATSPFSSAASLFAFLKTWPILLPAGFFGLIRAIIHNRTSRSRPVVLALLTALILCNHAPLFNHQVLLVAIPLAWLSAIGFSDAAGWIMCSTNRPVTRILAASICIGMALLALPNIETPQHVFNIPQQSSRDALNALKMHRTENPWIVTDVLIDAYYLGAKVPPSLAVYSQKRILSGNLPPALIISQIQSFQPDQIMFRRPSIRAHPDVVAYLRQQYRPVPDPRWLHLIPKTLSARTNSPNPTLRDLALGATRAFAGLSIHGGYSGFYDLEHDRLFERPSASMKSLPPGTITIRPPGSTALVGGCFLSVAQFLDDSVALQHAINAGRALACTQHPLGGWTATASISPDCQPASDATKTATLTLDEGTPRVVLDFLLDLKLDFETRGHAIPNWLELGIGKGFDFLLRTQLQNGGWPQQHFKPDHFSSLATLNDGVTTSCIAILLRGYATYHDDRLLAAAKRGGQFLIKAQGRPPLAGWSQQYTDDLRPTAARSFEPAALASLESGQAMRALVDLYLATKDPRFLEPLPRAAAWLTQAQTAPGHWARFYTLDSNRPLYLDRDGSIHSTVSELSEERRVGYQWDGAFPEVLRALRLADTLRTAGPDGLAEALRAENRREQEESIAKARQNVHSLLKQDMKQFWLEGTVVSTPRFISNCKDVITCLRQDVAP